GDEQGLDPAPNAINEGLADEFSSFLTGDGVEGEWSLGDQARDLNAHHVCPDLLWGEEHQDSAAISEPVWTLHKAHGQAIEKPVFTALAGLPHDADFEVTTAAIESALGDALGTTVKDEAHAAFADHGVTDCKRVITYTGPREILMSAGVSEVGVDPAPGYLQFKYPLAERAQNLKVKFHWSPGLTSMFGGGTASYKVVVRTGQPITWTYGINGAVPAKDYEFDLSAPSQASPTSEGTLPDLLAPGDYYVMIVGTGQVGGTLQNITITHEAVPQDDAAVPPPQDDAGAGDDAVNPNVGGRDGGCGCRAAATTPAGLVGLALLALLVLRRRRA
ncbi:MAG TPA: MYXO-CTERM sorting domain-containing protein, partial [Polyangia bacterium]